MKRHGGQFLTLAVLLVSLVAFGVQAHAAMDLSFTDNGGNSATYGDGGTGFISTNLQNPTVGTHYSVQAQGYPLLPSGLLSTSGFSLTNNGSTGVTFNFLQTQDGLLAPTGLQALLQQLSITSVQGTVSVSVVGYLDANDKLYGTATGNPPANYSGNPATLSAYIPNGPFTAGTYTGFAQLTSVNGITASSPLFNFAAPFSLSDYVIVTLGANSSVSFTTGLAEIPEPASVMLLGGALLVCGSLLRKKAARKS